MLSLFHCSYIVYYFSHSDRTRFSNNNNERLHAHYINDLTEAVQELF